MVMEERTVRRDRDRVKKGEGNNMDRCRDWRKCNGEKGGTTEG